MQAKITWYFYSNSDDNEDKEWLANAYTMKKLHFVKYTESEIQFVIYLYTTKFDIIENKFPFRKTYTFDSLSNDTRIPNTCISIINKFKRELLILKTS